jgi:hypothetical protein
MPEQSLENALNKKDAFNIGILVIYFGCLLAFSSFFYLATEDYEAVAAIDYIERGRLIGKSTGWPYTPLAAYLFYLYSLAFGPSVLGFRLLTGLLILSSIIPVYLILRALSGASIAFALTLLSYSLSTFPHPRLEYFVEGSVAAYAIFCGVRFLQRKRRMYLYCCALFAFIAFASRGHPNSSALLLLLPLSLVFIEWLIESKQFLTSSIARLAAQVRAAAKNNFGHSYALIWIFTLTIASFIWILIFLRNVVHKRLLVEYIDVNDLAAIPPIISSPILAWVLLIVVAAIYIAARHRGRATAFLIAMIRRAAPLVVPFVLVGILFVLVALLIGYPWNELMFFVFPVDIIADHQAVGRIGGRVKGVLPAFLVITGTTLYFYLNGSLQEGRAKIGLFLLLLVPATFARFFPTYNMLYLGIFPVAVFLGCILSCATRYSETACLRFKAAAVIFFIIYSVASNYLLLVRTQLEDLNTGELVKLQQGSLKDIFVEKDVFQLFEDIRDRLDRHDLLDEEPKGFLSSRYVKLTPLIYRWTDSFAGQNLMIQLGKIWSYDALIKIDGVESDDVFNWAGLIYRWREAAVDHLEQSQVKLIVMSLYDEKMLEEELEPSSDPFREYLRLNFSISDVIEPTMTAYRRSSFPEGAVILKRNAQESDIPADHR